MFALLLALLPADAPYSRPRADTTRAVWLADLHPDRVQPRPGHLVFVPGSRADDVTGRWCVEAAGPGGVLRTVSFANGETDKDLDVAAPIVVEGEEPGYVFRSRSSSRSEQVTIRVSSD